MLRKYIMMIAFVCVFGVASCVGVAAADHEMPFGSDTEGDLVGEVYSDDDHDSDDEDGYDQDEEDRPYVQAMEIWQGVRDVMDEDENTLNQIVRGGSDEQVAMVAERQQEGVVGSSLYTFQTRSLTSACATPAVTPLVNAYVINYPDSAGDVTVELHHDDYEFRQDDNVIDTIVLKPGQFCSTSAFFREYNQIEASYSFRLSISSVENRPNCRVMGVLHV